MAEICEQICLIQVPIHSKLDFHGSLAGPEHAIPVFRMLMPDGSGLVRGAHSERPSAETMLKMYQTMVTTQVMDTIFYDSQRQGRFGFYMTCTGEEASIVGSAAALAHDDVVSTPSKCPKSHCLWGWCHHIYGSGVASATHLFVRKPLGFQSFQCSLETWNVLQIFCQYREHAAFLWRGFTVQQMANQCFGNAGDPSKGRQMPIHYGSAELNMVTVSSVVATQAPHAVGAAYALKVSFHPDNSICVCLRTKRPCGSGRSWLSLACGAARWKLADMQDCMLCHE